MTGFVRAALAASAIAAALPCPARAASRETIELPGDAVYPESITATGDGTIYVSSLAGGGVTKVPPGGAKAEPFIAPGSADTRSTFGVLADEKSKTLWVCSNDASALGVAGPSKVKGSYLKGFDLETGKVKASAQLPGEKTLCNDIAVGADGAAYITNSLAPQVLRLKPGTDKLEVFAESPLFNPPAKGAGLDGIAFGADGALYVDKFAEAGLFRIDIKDGKPDKITELKTPQKLVLADALRPTDGGKAFLLVEGRGRLDRVTVAGDKATVETLKDGLNGPTGVAQAGDTAFVSEGQLPALFSGGKDQPKLPFDLKAVQIPTP